MQIAVLTFDGFNEIDSFVAAHILNRLRPQGWRAFITSPDAVITSANAVVVHAERPLEFAAAADAVIIGSGLKISEIAENRELLGRIRLDPTRQLIGSQCSGALLLAKLGLLARHVYMRGGFIEEGLLRRAYKLPDESRIDLILMSILRPEWLKQRFTRSAE